MEIDYSGWHGFRIGDLFESCNTGNILSRDVEDGSGQTPFVTSSGANNGVVAHIDASKYDLIPGNCILIGGKTFVLTYQKDAFVSNDSHNIVIRLKNKQGTPEEYLFLVTAIRVSLSHKYEWADAVTKDKLEEDIVMLPSKDGNPDWIQMRSIIKGVTKDAKQRVSSLTSVMNRTSKELNHSDWKLFAISDLFEVVPGTRLRKQDMKEGNINYVGASAFNNGITAKIGNTEALHPAGVLTVCYNGSVGRAFYQNEPFWATDDVSVLYPLFELTPAIAKFIIPVIYRVGSKYEYIDKWTGERIKESEIPLPVNSAGEPDWNYMENYINSLESKAHDMLAACNK